jgi:ribosome biogenesis GTPase / thiamine phosphate phosphatase
VASLDGTPDGLVAYGWSDALAAAFRPFAEQGYVPGRVITSGRGACRVRIPGGEVDATIQRGFRRAANGLGDYPAVGDWLALEPFPDGSGAALRAILPRTSAFVRKEAGELVDEQVIAANVDVVLLVTSMDRDFNLRRLERYLALAFGSGAEPVIVLNKLDACPDPGAYVGRVRAIAPTLSIHPVSALTGEGLDGLGTYLAAGRTVALLGSSGVGKSTIVNSLLGWERQRTATVREDDARGRHTTTARELVPLAGGAVLVDTPGMRALKLWDADDGVDQAFDDINALARDCRFRDCAHATEPGCAVRAAIDEGAVPRERLSAQRKLQRELRSLERRQGPSGSRAGQRRFGRQIRDATRTVERFRAWDAER